MAQPRSRSHLSSLAVGAVMAALAVGASATDAIPYSAPGTVNAVTYTFQAAADGDLVAYWVGGSGAGHDNQMGVLVNGVLRGYALGNHVSTVGKSFDFGAVNSGDTLVFVLHDMANGHDVYSDPSLNVGFDAPGVTNHNHAYVTSYTATSPVFAGVPAGVYVGMEDLAFPSSDYNYNDESFVVTNVSVTAVPEPSMTLMLLAGLSGLATQGARRRAGRALAALRPACWRPPARG